MARSHVTPESPRSPLQREALLPQRRPTMIPVLALAGLLLSGAFIASFLRPTPHYVVGTAHSSAIGWLGVSKLADARDGAPGIVVDSVIGCPAHRAGLASGDTILAWRSSADYPWIELKEMRSLQSMVLALPGESIELKVQTAAGYRSNLLVHLGAIRGHYPPAYSSDAAFLAACTQ